MWLSFATQQHIYPTGEQNDVASYLERAAYHEQTAVAPLKIAVETGRLLLSGCCIHIFCKYLITKEGVAAVEPRTCSYM